MGHKKNENIRRIHKYTVAHMDTETHRQQGDLISRSFKKNWVGYTERQIAK
jgi:hypothetical protein